MDKMNVKILPVMFHVLPYRLVRFKSGGKTMMLHRMTDIAMIGFAVNPAKPTSNRKVDRLQPKKIRTRLIIIGRLRR